MTQTVTGTGLGIQGSSLSQLGSYGPKGAAGLGQGGESVYVNAANGNVVLKQADGFLADVGFGLDLFQSYNSSDGKWRFNVETRLQLDGAAGASGSIIRRIDEDGHVSLFHYDSERALYVADDGRNVSISWNAHGFVYEEGSGAVQFHYDQQGFLSELRDRDGHVFSFEYEQGVLIRVHDGSGKQTVSWLFHDGRLTDVDTFSDGVRLHHLHYEYDELNRLSRVVRDLGDGKVYWVRYSYVDAGSMISDIDQSDGTSLHLDYDMAGRVRSLVDGEGRVTRYSYFAGETIISNGAGESWTYFYDSEQRLTGIDGPEGYSIHYQYEEGRLASVTQGRSRWLFYYDANGNCLQIEPPSGDILKRSYDEQNRILTETRYVCDAQGGLHAETRRFVYDERGHLRFEISADGTVTEHRYNADGLRVSTRIFLQKGFDCCGLGDTDALTLAQMTRWSDEQSPQAVSLVDYRYDWRGALLEEIHYNEVDSQGVGVMNSDTVVSYSLYDAAGRLIQTSKPFAGGFSCKYYFYDDLGRLIRVLDNEGFEERYEYDDEHQRVIQTAANGLQTINLYDKSGLLLSCHKLADHKDYGTTLYRYDDAMRLIAETTPDGQSVYTFYDGCGRIKAKVTSSGFVTEYLYDSEGYLLQTRQYDTRVNVNEFADHLPDFERFRPAISKQDRVSQNIYNDRHQLAFQIDSEGAITGFLYDKRGELIEKCSFAKRLTEHEPGKLLSIDETSFERSLEDRISHYYYDSEGRLIGEVNGEGAVTAYHYNRQGLLTGTRRYYNLAVPERTGYFSEDLPAESALDIATFSLYNKAGLKVADIDAEGYLVEYRYDARGLLSARIAYYNKMTDARPSADVTSLDGLRPRESSNDRKNTCQYNGLEQLVEERAANGLLTQYAYDETGLLVSKTCSDGKSASRETQLHYDALGRVVKSLDEMGSALLRQNPDMSAVEAEAVWDAHGISYSYDLAGRLASKTYAGGACERYYYNEEGQVNYTLGADGAITEFAYNSFGQVTRMVHYQALFDGVAAPDINDIRQFLLHVADVRFDEVCEYEYNLLGLVTLMRKGVDGVQTTTWNAFGEQETFDQFISQDHSSRTRFQYDRQGLLRYKIEDQGRINKTSEMEYDAFGRIAKTRDSLGNTTIYGVNRRGETVSIIAPGFAEKTMTVDAFGRTLSIKGQTEERFSFDDANHTMTLTREDNSTLVTSYNAFGDTITLTDGRGQTKRYQYDVKGALSRIDDPEGSFIDFSRDDNGYILTETRSGGQVTRFTYDAAGHVLTKTIDNDGVNLVTRYSWDGIGRQASILEGGALTRFTYDSSGRLIQKCTDPDGLNLITDFSYNAKGELTRQIIRNTGADDRTSAYEWDELGRCTASIIDPDGLHLQTSFDYDTEGNLVSETDANGQRTQFVYDSARRLSYKIDARGVVTRHIYDLKGNEQEQVTFVNRVTLDKDCDESSISLAIRPDTDADQHRFFSWDTQNRLFRSYDSKGFVIEYNYDANGNIIDKTEYANPVSLERLKQGDRDKPLASFDNRRTYFAYDGLNRQRYKADANGRLSEYRYNEAGMLVSETRFRQVIPIGIVSDDFSVQRLDEVKRPDFEHDEVRRYCYDHAGRLQAEMSAAGVVTRYQYNEAGNVVASTCFARLVDKNACTDDNFLTQVTASSNDRTSRFLFDRAGREVYRISAAGEVIERQYDAVGNVLFEIKHAEKAGSDCDIDTLRKQLAKSGKNEHKTAFEYDTANRLLSKVEGEQNSTRYSYDKSGNVASKTEANLARWTYHYNECNQLIEIIAPETWVTTLENGVYQDRRRAVKTTNEYDSFGNLVTVINDSEGVRQTTYYRYDCKNQCIATILPKRSINNAGAASGRREERMADLTENTSYNAFGEVTAREDASGHIRRFAYDSCGRLVFELDANKNLSKCSYDVFDNVATKTRFATSLVAALDEYSVNDIQSALVFNDHDRHEYFSYDLDHHLIETKKDAILSYDSTTGQYQMSNPCTRFTYSAFGEMLTKSVKLYENEWAITRFWYDKAGRQTATTDAENYLSLYEYDEFGNLSREIQFANRASIANGGDFILPEGSPCDRVVTCKYDALGLLTEKTLKQVSYQLLTGSNHFETRTDDLTCYYQYDAMGHLVKSTDVTGNTAFFYYNETGQMIAKVGELTGNLRPASTWRFDALGQLVESRQWAAGAYDASVESFTLKGATAADVIQTDFYDDGGHLTEQIDGSGHAVYFSYDEVGNIARRWELLQGNEQEVIRDLRYRYDGEHRLIQTATLKKGGGQSTEDALYNAFGEIEARGSNGLYAIHTDYDKAGRVWRSNTSGYYQIYVYDADAEVTQIVSSTSAIGSEYNGMGVDLSTSRFETAINFNDEVLRHDLQCQDNLYDKMGRLLLQVKDGSNDKKATSRQTVDRWGNILSQTNALGYCTTYEYNAFNQAIKQTLPEVRVMDETGTARLLSPVLYFAYDSQGRLIATQDANAHIKTRKFDALGQLIQETDARGVVSEKTYNLLGQMTASRTGGGNITSYEYDGCGRLTAISNSSGKQIYKYDGEGHLIEQTDALGNKTRYRYDEEGHQTERDKSGILTRYEYDATGRKIAEYDAFGNSQFWSYDEMGRLVQHKDLGGHETSYRYNYNGLLTSESSTSGKHHDYRYYSDGLLRQYSDVATGEVVNYEYDSEGHVIGKESSCNDAWVLETDQYQYDALGRLVKVRRHDPGDHANDLLSIDYEYDAVGNIRNTRLGNRYGQGSHITEEDWYSYDENDRMLVNKGQLVNGIIQATATQGSSLHYDDAGHIKDATNWEKGEKQYFDYHYNEAGLLDRIRKNNVDLQTREYDAAGNVKKETLFNSLGIKSQHNYIKYKNGRLDFVETTGQLDTTISKSFYEYDAVGNLKRLVTTTPASKGVSTKQTHEYDYSLWDSYQQSSDTATFTATGHETTKGSSTRIYDVNGQLAEAVDSKFAKDGSNNSAYYLNSSLDGLRARRDKDGQTSYLTVAGKTIGDLKIDHNGKGTLDVYSGFTPKGTPEIGLDIWKFQTNPLGAGLEMLNNKPKADASLPDLPQNNIGTYTLQAGDTLDNIALQVYGDASLWYLIADANGLSDRNAHTGEAGSAMQPGQTINIPQAAGTHHTSNTQKVLNGYDLIGDTSATTPIPPPPPPPKQRMSAWKILGIVAVSVVAVLATVISAGIISTSLSNTFANIGGLKALLEAGTAALTGAENFATALTTGFAAGTAGSLTAQTMAMLTGMQPGIDWGGALITGMATAATAGISSALHGTGAYGKIAEKINSGNSKFFNAGKASDMLERSVIEQSINKGVGKGDGFDWATLGANAATTGFMTGALGQRLDTTLQTTFGASAETLSSEVESLVNSAVSLMLGQGHLNAGKVLLDNLGSAIGNNLISFAKNMATDTLTNGIDRLMEEEHTTTPAETTEEPIGLGKLIDAAKQQTELMVGQGRDAWEDPFDELSFGSSLYKTMVLIDTSPVKEEVLWGDTYGSDKYTQDPAISVDSMKLTLKPSKSGKFDIDYDALIVKHPGSPYRKSQIVPHSHYYQTPGSPISGDASKDTQIEAIDALITASKSKGLSSRETAYVLAIARHESGFNPYAAAGTTSASGLGQFVDGTGYEYNLGDANRWNINEQAEALVNHFIDNKALTTKKRLPESYIYKFHHDGPTGNYGGLTLSKKFIIPKIGGFIHVIQKVF